MPQLTRTIAVTGFVPEVIPPVGVSCIFASASDFAPTLTDFPSAAWFASVSGFSADALAVPYNYTVFSETSGFAPTATVVPYTLTLFESQSTFAPNASLFTSYAVFQSSSALLPSATLLRPVAAAFSSASSLSAEAEVSLGNRANFEDVSGFTVRAVLDGQVEFDSVSEFLPTARLNDEANVFPLATFASDSEFIPSPQATLLVVAQFFNASGMTAEADVVTPPEFGFTIFVDVLDEGIQDAITPSNDIRRTTARLMVDGVSVPIIKATLDSPPDRLGTELKVVLARPDITAVTLASVIDFDIGLWVAGAWVWIPLLVDGKLSQRGASYANDGSLPRDSVELSIVDIMGDRWNRAPRRQVTYYDPQKVEAPTPEALSSMVVYTDTGGKIEPVFSPIPNLSFTTVLSLAYVDGCGFSNIVTNIPNFPVELVSFTMSGGYDAGVRSMLSTFSPVVFVVNNSLWIIDPDAPLPAGLSAIDFIAKYVVDISDTLPPSGVNALLVKLRDDSGYEFTTERLETSNTDNGRFGSPEFTETRVERRIREFRNSATPSKLEREETVYIKTRIIDADFNDISLETRTDKFDSRGRHMGYKQSIESSMPVPVDTGSLVRIFSRGDDGKPQESMVVATEKMLQLTHEEDQTIYYAPDPMNGNRDLQHRIETYTRGLILVDSGNKYKEEPYKLPYVDAHKSGYIANTDQDTEFGLIRTTIEQLRFNGGQVQYETRVINHIAKVPDRITIRTLPGNSSVDHNKGEFRSVLLTIPGTDTTGRRIAEFDATTLPAALGLTLAKRRLRNLNVAPKEANVNMPFVNPSIRRGTTIRLAGRLGYLGTYIVKGSTIEFTAIDMNQFSVRMSITARELKS